MRLAIPELSFVVLIGPAGSGKSTFACRHFRPTEVLSSDAYRALVSDDENDETATEAAFEVLYQVARKRFAAGRLAVLDATNVTLGSRKKAVALAREYDRLPLAIVFDLPETVCHGRNRQRPERSLEEHLVREQIRLMHRALPELEKEGFRQVYRLTSVEEVEAVTVVREPLERERLADPVPACGLRVAVVPPEARRPPGAVSGGVQSCGGGKAARTRAPRTASPR